MATSHFPPLDTILRSVGSIDKGKEAQPKVWDPHIQAQFTAKASGQPSLAVGSATIGQAVASVPSARQTDLFMQNYVKQQDGVRDIQQSMKNAAEVYRKAKETSGMVAVEHVCKVYPPLLVRYSDPRYTDDQYVPVELLAAGELKYTRHYPDLVLNFHAQTHAITVTVCHIDPRKMEQYNWALQTLYSMTVSSAQKMLTVDEFTTLYDNTRYTLLRSAALRAST